MSKQHYRVVADRDRGDDILFEGQPGDIEIRDWETGELLRIERPVPSTIRDVTPPTESTK